MDAVTKLFDPLAYKVAVGEVAWLWRHRAKLSSSRAAEAKDVTRAAWSELELEWQHENGCSLVTGWLSTPVTNADRLRLLRRRLSLLHRVHRDALAHHLRVSHVTYLKWEAAADPRLVAWWRSPGYTLLQL